MKRSTKPVTVTPVQEKAVYNSYNPKTNHQFSWYRKATLKACIKKGLVMRVDTPNPPVMLAGVMVVTTKVDYVLTDAGVQLAERLGAKAAYEKRNPPKEARP